MPVSAIGRAAIRQREGEVLHAYKDTVGVWTIGSGHTGRMSGALVKPGMTITREQSDAFLAADLAPVEATIAKLVKVPLTQNEYDAIASWLFNVGVGDLKGSTILRKLNLGDIQGAANGFDLYHKPPEIIGRRDGEKRQFLTPDTTTDAVATHRASALAGHAQVAKEKAKTASVVVAPAVVIAAGSAAAAIAHVPHGHWALLGFGALATALAAGATALFHNGKAKALAANAQKQG